MKRLSFRLLTNQKGVTIVLVAILLVVLIGFAAIAVDLAYLYIVKGELQNAADSGALAGAQVLYITDPLGVQVNPAANDTARALVIANYSEQSPVSIKPIGPDFPIGGIERGHWSFATRTFTPNDSLIAVSLWNVTSAQLDANTNFINAVRVITTRKIVAATGLPEEPFFARIFGSSGQPLEAVAVAYIGFAGTLEETKVDQPIAICKQGITDPTTGKYTCGVGRMINSGSNAGHQTGGWTNFSQSPCETASSNSVRPLVCANGNPDPIVLGQGMGTTGGELQNVFDRMIDCWQLRADSNGDGIPDRPWSVTLPVIDCPGNNTGNCSTVVGAVELNIVWMTRNDKNQFNEVPRSMYNPLKELTWNCSTTGTTKADGQKCWSEFVEEFKLKDVLNQSPAFYEDKTMYFVPDCKAHIPMGTTGGQNFGILARIPVLVK
jgi:hypothetical protein